MKASLCKETTKKHWKKAFAKKECYFMTANEIVSEWMHFADMDYKTAVYLFETMKPMPLEIICYHCQQSSEKY